MKIMPIWERFAIIIEVALVCLLIFKVLVMLLQNFVGTSFFYIGVIAVHYTVILICGFWTGWKTKTDGWLYAILAFFLFYLLRQLFKVYHPIPLAYYIRLLMFVPALALLLVGAVYGEIAAERRDMRLNDTDKEAD